MKIKSIILNVLYIIILVCLIYFFIYLNNSNFENFYNLSNPGVKIVTETIVQEPVSVDSLAISVSSIIDIAEEVKVNNGATYDRPLKNANFGYILESVAKDGQFTPRFINGYYWVNIENVGPQFIYCIMDKSYFGGGWMLAMRSVIGSKNFSYNSEHFTKPTTLNNKPDNINNINSSLNSIDYNISSIGNHIYNSNLDPDIYDAKFETFNNTSSSEWMAIFYVKDNADKIITGGDYEQNKRGWVWYEKNVKIEATDNFNKKFNKLVPPYQLFKYLDENNRERKISGQFAQNMYGKFTNAKNRSTALTNILFSSQPISANNKSFYGLNYKSSRDVSKVRWGFSFNDSNDSNNDAFSGIGTNYGDTKKVRGSQTDKGYSAGNFEIYDEDGVSNTNKFLDRPKEELRNASYAVEWYVRENAANCAV